jgi:hypothetical protein
MTFRAPATPFVVIKRMPERDGEFEYRLRSTYEPHERVVRESAIADDACAARSGPCVALGLL